MSATGSHSFDVLGAILLTVAAAYVCLLLLISLARSDASRAKAALIPAAWFGAIVALSRTSLFDGTAGFGTIAVGVAIAIPVVAFTGLLVLSPRARAAAAAAPLATLISLHAVRIFGADFLWLQEMGRLGFPFAPVAGWGDIIVGIAALPVAAAIRWKTAGWRQLAWTFTVFGTIDLLVAVSLGITSAPDSPVRLFFSQTQPTLTVLPWLLVPAFLVPAFLIGHISAWRILAAGAHRPGRADDTPATSVARSVRSASMDTPARTFSNRLWAFLQAGRAR